MEISSGDSIGFWKKNFRKVEPRTSLSKELAEQLKDNPEWVEIQEEVLS